MTVRIKNGGAWYVVPHGAIRVKSGTKDGGQWAAARTCKIKYNGAWVDSGYTGTPNPPQNFGIPAWSFTGVSTTWSAPAAGGAPVSHYEVVKTDAAGNWNAGFNPPRTTTTTNYSFAVVEDERLQLYVRSVSTGGVFSSWAGPLRVQIGHTEITHPENQARTEQWVSPLTSFNLYLANYALAVYVPGDVLVTTWYINAIGTNAAWTKLSIPGTNRRMHHIFANVPQWGPGPGPAGTPNITLDWNEPTSGWFGYNHWGANSGWGFAVDGTDWSPGSTGPNRVVGEFQIWGNRHYTVTVTVYDRYRVENTTW